MPPKRKAATKAENAKLKTPRNVIVKKELPKKKNWLKLFEKYRDPDEPTKISPEGCQALFKDLGVSLESITPFIIAWKMNAARMGFITEEEWAAGNATLSVDSITKFKKALPGLEKKTLEDEEQFKELYVYCFPYAKSPLQKSMDLETALALWDVLLVKKYPMMKSFIQFIKEEGPVKVINKDQWTSLLDFCKSVGDNLDNYDSTSSWPVLFDDYVEWKNKSQ